MVLTTVFPDGDVPHYHLSSNPLIRVIGQVQFPKQPELATESGIEPIRAALREMYPILREDRVLAIVVGTDGVTTQPQPNPVWRLQDAQSQWQVSISDSFVALDTSAYDNQADFCARLDDIVKVIHTACDPTVFDRVGLRYVDRLEGDDALANLPRWVRPEVLSGFALQSEQVSVQQSICQTMLSFPHADALARWGTLPPAAVFDPAIAPVPTTSWILDVDVFRARTEPFDPAVISELTRVFAKQAYRFFLWAMTKQFIADRGGNLEAGDAT